MAMNYSPKAVRHADAINAALAPALLPGEHGWFVTKINRIRGNHLWVVVTNWRILVLGDYTLRVVLAFNGSDITAWRTSKRLDDLLLTTPDGQEHNLGSLLVKADIPYVGQLLDTIRHAPRPAAPPAGAFAPAREAAPFAPVVAPVTPAIVAAPPAPPVGDTEAAVASEPTTTEPTHQHDVTAPGGMRAELSATGGIVGTVSNKAWKVIESHCHGPERPWFVLGVGQGGVMACFGDRLMIVKVGALTAFQAGATGGGRIATIAYRDITGIEYNSGFLNGVLEVSTPAYQGAGNKDFWRGAGRSPNKDNGNPFAASNTLPLPKPVYQQVMPQLNELRARIARSKETVVHVGADAPAGPSPAQELAQLGELHANGVLTSEEFATAKAAVIARMSATS